VILITDHERKTVFTRVLYFHVLDATDDADELHGHLPFGKTPKPVRQANPESRRRYGAPRTIAPVFFLPELERGAVPVPPETLPPNRVSWRKLGEVPMVRYRPWTDGDVARLRHLAERYPAELIAERLGRRLMEINMKAHELRISLKPKFGSGLDPGPAGMDDLRR
jgi:hypothetical protein